jgi:hypothetical protein
VQSDGIVIAAATNKLFLSDTMNPGSRDHVLALFSQRFGLELGVSESAAIAAVDAVKKHMRILLRVVDKSLVVTDSPPEPIMAIACALQLQRPGFYAAALKTLVKELVTKELVVDRGREGELYTRILLVMTMDLSVPRPLIVDRHVRPVALKSFLTTLLGEDLGLAADADVTELRTQMFDSFRDVHLNFTHVVQLSHVVDELSTDLLYDLWCRGAVARTHLLQTLIDGFIVGYRGDLKQPFNPSCLFVIPWQAKAKADPVGLQDIVPFLTCPRIVTSRDDGPPWKPEGYLALFLELGTEALFQNSGKRVRLEYKSARHPPPGCDGKRWGGYMPKEHEEPKRWCLNIRGHSADTFKVINGNNDFIPMLLQRSQRYTEPRLATHAQWLVNRVGYGDYKVRSSS